MNVFDNVIIRNPIKVQRLVTLEEQVRIQNLLLVTSFVFLHTDYQCDQTDTSAADMKVSWGPCLLMPPNL